MGYLSETTRRRIAAVILILGIATAVLAITDTAVFDDPPTPEQRVASAVSEFFTAAADQDFERDCELLTRDAQAVMRTAAARVIEEADRDPKCPQILELVLADTFSSVNVRIRSVNIEGNRARAEVALKPEGEPSSFRTILLELSEEGDWQISDFG